MANDPSANPNSSSQASQEQDLNELAKELEKQWNQLNPSQKKQIEDLAKELESKLGDASPDKVDENKEGQSGQNSQPKHQRKIEDLPKEESPQNTPEPGESGDGQVGDGQAGEGQAGDGGDSNTLQKGQKSEITSPGDGEGAGGSQEGYQQHAENHQQLMEMIEEFKQRSMNQDIPDSYAYLKSRNKQLIDELSDEVRHIFEDDAEPQLEGDYRSGIYNLQKAIESKARSQATGHKDDKIFLRKTHPEEKSVELVICLDTSGSMGGENMSYAKDAVVVVGEMANKLKLPWGLLTFSNHVDMLKVLNKSEEEHSWEQRLVDAYASGGTDDFAALEKAVEMFTESESEAEKKIILFMTDGSGNYKQSEYVKQMQDEGYWVIGVGIGDGTSHVTETYDRSIHVPNVQDLPLELAQLLLELLREGT